MEPSISFVDPRPRGADALPLLAAAAGLAVYLASEAFVFSGQLGFPLDDSWIHMQFARQIAAGEGLAYNPGRWVAGSSAPLWTALVALVQALPLPPLWGVKLLGAACLLATVHATGRLAAELGLSRGLRHLAAVLVATSHWLLWAALAGMEVHLFTALTLWGLVLHLRERAAGGFGGASLPLLALAGLARPEGFLLLALAIAERTLAGLRERAWRRDLARLAVPLAAAVLAVAPVLLFFRLIGDSFLPTTFAVKAGDPDFLPSGRYLRAAVDVLFRSQPVALLFAGAGILRLAERPGTARGRGLLPAAWVLGLPLAYSLLAADNGPVIVGNFGRYLFPLLPLVAVLGVLGWQRPARRLGRPARVALVTAALLPQLWGLAAGVPLYLRTIANVEDGDVAAARWLAERLPPDALVAVQDAGALKYHLPNPVLDLTGIVNPEILPHLRGADWERELYGYLAARRPAYLVVFPEYYPRLVTAPGFRRVRSFPVRDNVALAGDELVVFATPWTGPWGLREGDPAASASPPPGAP